MAIFHTNQFRNLLIIMVFTVFLLSMIVPRAAQSEDSVLFGFENGELHNFVAGKIVNDSSNTYAGNGALKVSPSIDLGGTYYDDVARWAPVAAPAGTTLNLYVYEPAGNSASLLVYVYDANWVYSGVFVDGSSLAADSWKKVSLKIPENAATPLIALGVQTYASTQATLWIDSIGYQSQAVAAAASVDSDGDGLSDSQDNCPVDSNPGQADADKDGIGDACDQDSDNDGVPNDQDNCVADENPNQEDTDGDGKGDVCDDDIDGDGVPNGQDNCILDFNPDQQDFDGDGIGDACDADSDQDGVIDASDACLETPLGLTVSDNGCSIDQTCPVENNWSNPHAYIRCVAYTSTKFLATGLITKRERNSAVSAAVRKAKGEKKIGKKNLHKRESFRFHKREKQIRQHHDGYRETKKNSIGFNPYSKGYTSRFLSH